MTKAFKHVCVFGAQKIVRNFNGPMSLFTVKDLKPASPPFFVRLFKIRIFESFMEMRPPIFGVI